MNEWDWWMNGSIEGHFRILQQDAEHLGVNEWS